MSIVLHSGNVSSFRWRGPRQGTPLITYLESIIQDATSIKRRAWSTNPNPPKQILLPQQPTVPGIYGLGGADPRNDQYAEGLSDLGPITWELNMIRIQSIRTQLATLLSSA